MRGHTPASATAPTLGQDGLQVELHIASLVVHAAPRRVEQVAQVVAGIEGARVHGSSAAGKVVVTLEAASMGEMTAKVSTIQHADGVLSTAMVYQCVDSLEAMNKEFADDHAQTGLR
jgi:periplasmic nitrate reductase NapD